LRQLQKRSVRTDEARWEIEEIEWYFEAWISALLQLPNFKVEFDVHVKLPEKKNGN